MFSEKGFRPGNNLGPNQRPEFVQFYSKLNQNASPAHVHSLAGID